MTTTKGIASPAPASLDWDTPLNDNFSKIEKAFGNSVNITATAGNYALSSAEMGNMALRCVGALTADLTIQTATGTAGQWVVINNTTDATGGPWRLFVSSLAGGSPIEIERGVTRSVYSDGTATGVLLADTAVVSTANIEDGAVTTPKIADGAVTTAKMVYTPVEQGGGVGMGSSKVRLGWASTLLAQIDATPVGSLIRLVSSAITGGSDEMVAPGNMPLYACRSWVNFQGTGTVTIRASGNVSSVVRVATGAYHIIFTTPMPDNYYSVVFACSPEVNSQHAVGFITEMTTTYCRVDFYSAANSTNKVDKSVVCVSIFR